MTTDTDRVFLKYAPDGDADQGEVSLPAYLDAVPSIVAPGDVFSVPARVVEEHVDAFVESNRFEPVNPPANPSRFSKMTKGEIGEVIGVDPDAFSKDELIGLGDDYDRMHPPIPPQPGSVRDEDAVPVFGQGDPDDDDDDNDPGDPPGDNDNPEGSNQ